MKSPLTVLAESGLPLLLVGGTAVQVFGYGRFTKDFDCLIAHESDAELAAVLEAADYEQFDRSPVVARYRHRQNPLLVLDTLLVNAETFAKMWAMRSSVRLATFELSVAAPLHVIAMKLHAIKSDSRRKFRDLVDVLEIIRLKHATFTREDLHTVCQRYGTVELEEEVLRTYDSRSA